MNPPSRRMPARNRGPSRRHGGSTRFQCRTPAWSNDSSDAAPLDRADMPQHCLFGDLPSVSFLSALAVAEVAAQSHWRFPLGSQRCRQNLRLYCPPHNCAPVSTSISSAQISRLSPRCITLPVSTARTSSSRPTFLGSLSRPLNRKTVLRAITRNFGRLARTLIRVPVIPSLRYSFSGSLLEFSNGKTASESMILEILGRRTGAPPKDVWPDCNSCFSRCKSFLNSTAL